MAEANPDPMLETLEEIQNELGCAADYHRDGHTRSRDAAIRRAREQLEAMR